MFFIAFAVAALLLSDFVTLAAYAALRPLAGWRPTPVAVQKNTFFLLAAQLLFYVLILGYIYLLVVFHYRLRFWAGLNWRRLDRAHVLRYVLAGIAITVGVQLAPSVLPDKSHFPLERLFSSPDSSYAIAAFAVLVAPFMEEIVFRGVLFSVFETRIGLRTAIVVTAVLFAALHMPEYWGAWQHVLLIFLVGLAFSLARGLTGSLTPSFVLHVTYNACLMIGLFFATSHFHAVQSAFLIGMGGGY